MTASRIGFWTGLVFGLFFIVFASVLPRPDGLSVEAFRALGVTIIVGVWWVTEALPLGATALIPAASFPLLGIATAKQIAPSYASSFILLLLGGFLLALAVERSGVHRRIALHVLLLVGTSPSRLVLGFAVATAAMSMWISNTASTLIMMPIVLAIVDRALEAEGEEARPFVLAVLLGMGYGASIGGMGTPIGTPPNVIAMAALEELYPQGPELSFLSWASIAIPIVCLLVPVMWFVLTRIALKIPDQLNLGAAPMIREELKRLGPWRSIEKRALSVFGLAAFFWMTRKGFSLGDGVSIPGWASLFGLGKAPDDGTVAMFAAVIAFSLPSGEPDRSKLLPWATAVKVPWDLVLLFGGGIALAKGFTLTGLSEWLGSQLALLGDSSQAVFVGSAALAATFGTEVISNTALSNIAMPILALTAQKIQIDPRVLLVPCALACSCAFMMPAATGPNAIIFGTGRIRIWDMVRVGFWINLIAWGVITSVSLFVYG
ncbi:MAG: SLC13 family permease [Myxococcota bacterium]|nr:SLC13 family permease [Myxococcota bacterium]